MKINHTTGASSGKLGSVVLSSCLIDVNVENGAIYDINDK